jgi:hypothetical protein
MVITFWIAADISRKEGHCGDWVYHCKVWDITAGGIIDGEPKCEDWTYLRNKVPDITAGDIGRMRNRVRKVPYHCDEVPDITAADISRRGA